jgi:hypothetical protein
VRWAADPGSGQLASRGLDDAFGLTAVAASALTGGWRGKSIRHRPPGLRRQAVHGRRGGDEEVDAAARRTREPAAPAVVGAPPCIDT